MGFLVATASILSLGLLAWAGMGHLLHGSSLTRAIRQQALIRPSLASMAAGLVMCAELGIGIGGLLALLMGFVTPVVEKVALWSAAALYSIFAAYTFVLLRAGSAAPCGCSSRGRPVTVWIVSRNILLAAASVVSAMVAFPHQVLDASSGAWVVALVAGAALGWILWSLPEALGPPDQVEGA